MVNHLSSWISHCKQFANQNGIKYRDALKDKRCREQYHNQKGKAKQEQPNTHASSKNK